MSKKWVFPALHILVWSLLVINKVRDFMQDYPSIPYDRAWVAASGWSPLACAIILNFAYLLVSIAGFYTAYAWTGPSLFPRRRYGRALLSILGVCTAMVITRYIMEFRLLRPVLHFENYFGRPVEPWTYIKNCVSYSFNYALFGVIVYFLRRSGRAQQERVKAELAFLKSQVNPHFLFNTINDIYALAYQKSDQTPEALLKLSGILRYSLYEDGLERVSLARELAYLTDYLDLQRIGSKQRTYIDFQVEGEPDRLQIAPLLLIPFAENIVKHGIIDDPATPASLHIRARNGHFELSAINRVKAQLKDSAGGIGLSNVRRRLELLYPGLHSFRVSEQEGIFECTLALTLTLKP
jgi:two-component system, LytTR family, sensor kinase